MKRCFLTGGTGFVGSALTRLLIADGFEVGILVRDRQKANRVFESSVNAHVFDGDLQNAESINHAMNDFRPDTLIHLGWGGITSGDRDLAIQLTNQAATINLVQTAIRMRVKTVVGLGSQAEYGPKEGIINEKVICEPLSLYGACKLACCCITEQLCRIASIRFAWLRLFSCYGPGDTPSFMIPSVIEKLLQKERPALTGALQIWDYLFVDDAASAIAHVAKTPQATGIFNLGSGIGVTLRTVVEQLRDLIDTNLPLGFGDLAYGTNQIMHLQADISKLQGTGWKPKTPQNEGLKMTVNWHKKQKYS